MLAQAKEHVVVVGAGLAGLAAAYDLHKSGHVDVTVVEAKERVGGRVFSVYLEGPSGTSVAELGGQNLTDGGDFPTAHRLINEMGLSALEEGIPFSWTFYDEATSSCIDAEDLRRELLIERPELKDPEFVKNLTARHKNLADLLKTLLPEEGPLYRSFYMRLAAWDGGTPDDLDSSAWETLFYMLQGGIAETHQSTSTVNLASVSGGNAKLPMALARVLGEKVILGKPLKSLSEREGNKIALTFQDGSEMLADSVVLAVPCASYKKLEIDARILPIARKAFLNSIPMGFNTKILLPLKIKNPPYSAILTDAFPAFFNADKTVLNLYFSGLAGRDLKDNFPQSYQMAYQVIQAVFKDALLNEKRPAEIEDEVQFATYKTPVTHFWVQDPYAGGSYSYRSVRTAKEHDEEVQYQGETLRRVFLPINNRLYFAGEHTAVVADLGTMEGACESGAQMARLILNSL